MNLLINEDNINLNSIIILSSIIVCAILAIQTQCIKDS